MYFDLLSIIDMVKLRGIAESIYSNSCTTKTGRWSYGRELPREGNPDPDPSYLSSSRRISLFLPVFVLSWRKYLRNLTMQRLVDVYQTFGMIISMTNHWPRRALLSCPIHHPHWIENSHAICERWILHQLVTRRSHIQRQTFRRLSQSSCVTRRHSALEARSFWNQGLNVGWLVFVSAATFMWACVFGGHRISH